MVVINVIWERNSNLYQLQFNWGSIQLFCLMNYIVYKLFKIAQYSSGNLRLYDWGWSFFSSKNMQRLPTSWGSYRKWCTVSLSELRLPSLTYEQSSWSAYEHYRTLMANPARTNWGDAWGMVWSELTSLYYEHVKSTNICIG